MAVVLDASVAIAWWFPDEAGTLDANAVATRLAGEPGITSGIFWNEIRNVLVRSEWRERISSEGTMRFLERMAELDIEVDTDHVETETLALARRHRLTVYDASYLETAIRRQAELATLDRDLAIAARREGMLTVVLPGGDL